MTELELHHRLATKDFYRCYQKQAFAYGTVIPTFEDIYDEVLEMVLIENNQNTMNAQPITGFDRVLLLNWLLESGCAFVINHRVQNAPQRMVW